MRRLIRVYAGRTCHTTDFYMELLNHICLKDAFKMCFYHAFAVQTTCTLLCGMLCAVILLPAGGSVLLSAIAAVRFSQWRLFSGTGYQLISSLIQILTLSNQESARSTIHPLKAYTVFFFFLAHLSSAQDELLRSLFVRRPSVRASVRPSVNIFKRLLLWNRWANFAQISYEASLRWGNEKLLKWSRSVDQDGRHAHIW